CELAAVAEAAKPNAMATAAAANVIRTTDFISTPGFSSIPVEPGPRPPDLAGHAILSASAPEGKRFSSATTRIPLGSPEKPACDDPFTKLPGNLVQEPGKGISGQLGAWAVGTM